MELPATPCRFDRAFLDELLEFDPDRSLVRCRMPTLPKDPFTAAQRTHPVRHPAHVAGATVIQATASLGFVHAYYMLGLRHREGSVGYGTHIHKGVFRGQIPPGTDVEATCIATRIRPSTDRYAVRYSFEFRGHGTLYCEGDQTAFWFRTEAVTDGKSTAAPASA